MGIDPVSLSIGGSILGSIGGAISGGSGTPDQTTEQSSQLQLGEIDPELARLRGLSADQFEQGLQQIALQEQLIQRQDPLAQAGAARIEDILGAEAFGPSTQEQELINRLSEAQIGQSQLQQERFLDEQLERLRGEAGARNVRGQALSELEIGAVQTASERLADAQRQAEIQGAQLALQLPQQRAQLQSQLATGQQSLQQQLQQQAIQNRLAAQNPALMQQLQQERVATGKQTGTTFTPGQQGSVLGAITGGVGGALTGGAAGINVGSGIANIQASQALTKRLGQQTGGGTSATALPNFSFGAVNTSGQGRLPGGAGSTGNVPVTFGNFDELK